MQKSDIWVVVPGYNEEKYISGVLSQIKKITKNIIFVNDGSVDNTFDKSLKSNVYILNHKVNLGKGAALKTGINYAFNYLRAQAIIIIDADAQHNPQEIKLFTEKLKKGHDLVLGIRNLEKMPSEKNWGNRLASYLVWFLYGYFIPDIPSGYKAFSKKIYQQIEWHSPGYGVEMEIAIKIAKNKLKFETQIIDTIYHDLDKGVTLLDAMNMALLAVKWRLTP